MADLPLVLPSSKVGPEEFDEALAAGMRRAGYFLYFVACQGCRSCQPTRLPVRQFHWSDSWRRIRIRGDRELELSLGTPETTDEKVALFNLHRDQRGLADDHSTYQKEDYEGFLVESSCQWTSELHFRNKNRLVAVSVIDCGLNSVSAVYTYFDPEYSKLSLGTYSILKQIEFCLNTNREYLYLGMYVADNRHLNYKMRFQPQQRWVEEKWIDVDPE